MDKWAEALGGLVFFGGMVLIVYFIARYTYLIRKLMAEKGLLNNESKSRITKIDVAFATIGVGLGLVIAAGLSAMGLDEGILDTLSWGIVLILGASGLLISSRQKK
ncbi:MAG: hypothetical protein AAFY71_10515 [Bacteroidota bacterium]